MINPQVGHSNVMLAPRFLCSFRQHEHSMLVYASLEATTVTPRRAAAAATAMGSLPSSMRREYC